MKSCERTCKHGHRCIGHTLPHHVEVRTHCAVDGAEQHRFWQGSAGWQCVVLDEAALARIDAVRWDA